jgi:hypothetical protein
MITVRQLEIHHIIDSHNPEIIKLDNYMNYLFSRFTMNTNGCDVGVSLYMYNGNRYIYLDEIDMQIKYITDGLFNIIRQIVNVKTSAEIDNIILYYMKKFYKIKGIYSVAPTSSIYDL